MTADKDAKGRRPEEQDAADRMPQAQTPEDLRADESGDEESAPRNSPTDAEERQDAAGYDVAAVPGLGHGHSGNPGLHDEPSVEEDGWRTSDTNREFDWENWRGDEPYPGRGDRADAEADEDAGEVGEIHAEGGDVLETVTDLLTDHPELDITDVSVEVRGDTVILRGSAGSGADRERAGDMARAVPGVAHVENLMAAR